MEHDDDDEFTGQLPNIRHHKQHENMAADNPNHVKSDLDRRGTDRALGSTAALFAAEHFPSWRHLGAGPVRGDMSDSSSDTEDDLTAE